MKLEEDSRLREGQDKISDLAAAKEHTHPLAAFYDRLNVSVRTLDRLIAVLLVLIVSLVLWGASSSKGLRIDFDSQGGSPVPEQYVAYEDLLREPEPPTREGFTFKAWSTDREGERIWDFAHTRVQDEITLYAIWK